jgi:carbonic anhydrase
MTSFARKREDQAGGSQDSGARRRSAREALAALKEGNRRFVVGKVRHAHQAADWRAHLTSGQDPFATILACSDSRVPPELVFDQGLGDLFVIRVAGNIIAREVIGSIGYAVRHLGTQLVVVMGHEGCGAVTAALEAMDGKGREPRFIANLLKHILPCLKRLDPSLQGDRRIRAAVEANVRQSAALLVQLPGGRMGLEQKRVQLAMAVYELRTGRVRFLARGRR